MCIYIYVYYIYTYIYINVHLYIYLSLDRYRAPAELFTMFACLFSDARVQEIIQALPKDWLSKHTAGLRASLENYCLKHGVAPHPAVLLKDFLDSSA